MALPLPKLLIVGSLDRLDATLEAGHMQGRFRLELVAHVGHYIHEDLPEKVAEAIGQFLLRLKQQEEAFARLMSSPKRQRLE